MKKIRGSAVGRGAIKRGNTRNITQQDMACAASQLPGCPIRKDHEPGDRGRITKSWIGPNHELQIEAEIDRTTFEGAALIKDIQDKKLHSLSVGHFSLELDPGKETGLPILVAGKRMREVSVTGNPDQPNTHIDYIEPDDEGWMLNKLNTLERVLAKIKGTKHYKTGTASQL